MNQVSQVFSRIMTLKEPDSCTFLNPVTKLQSYLVLGGHLEFCKILLPCFSTFVGNRLGAIWKFQACKVFFFNDLKLSVIDNNVGILFLIPESICFLQKILQRQQNKDRVWTRSKVTT